MWLKIHELPWRERPQAKMKRLYAIQMGAVIGGVMGLWGAAHLMIASQLTHQGSLHQQLTEDAQQVDHSCTEIHDLEKSLHALQKRRSAAAQLQSQQSHMVPFLEDCARLMPEGVSLNHLSRIEDQVLMQGKAQSHQQIALLMRHLVGSPWLESPQLSLTQSEGGSIAEGITFDVRALYILQKHPT